MIRSFLLSWSHSPEEYPLISHMGAISSARERGERVPLFGIQAVTQLPLCSLSPLFQRKGCHFSGSISFELTWPSFLPSIFVHLYLSTLHQYIKCQ